jgi:hypothetical protein
MSSSSAATAPGAHSNSIGSSPTITITELLVMVLAVAVLLASLLLLWDYEVDDAYILLRYARNLAAGHGLTFNPGAPPVEGYSDFLLVLLGAVLLRLGADPMLTYKLLCCASALLCLPLLHLMARRLGASSGPACLASLMLAATTSIAFWTVSGLETSLFMLLLLLATWLFLQERSDSDLAAALLFVVAALVRPEAPVYMAGLCLVRLLRYLRERIGWRPVLAKNWAWLLTFSVLYGGYFTFRYVYFGVLLPNPVYFKRGVESASLLDSVSAVFIGDWWPFLLVAAAGMVITRLRDRAAYLQVLPLIALAVYSHTYHFVAGSVGTMAFFDRYLVPVLPPLLISVALAIDHGLRQRHRVAKIASCLVASGLVVWLLHGSLLQYSGMRRAVALQKIGDVARDLPLTDYINHHYGAEAEVALGDVGQCGYLIEGTVLDLFGLTSTEFTLRLGRDVDAYLSYLISLEPDAFVLVGEVVTAGWSPKFYADMALMENPDFHTRYVHTHDFGRQDDPSYFYLLFERRPEQP